MLSADDRDTLTELAPLIAVFVLLAFVVLVYIAESESLPPNPFPSHH